MFSLHHRPFACLVDVLDADGEARATHSRRVVSRPTIAEGHPCPLAKDGVACTSWSRKQTCLWDRCTKRLPRFPGEWTTGSLHTHEVVSGLWGRMVNDRFVAAS